MNNADRLSIRTADLEPDGGRRSFCARAAIIAGAQLGAVFAADAQTSATSLSRPGAAKASSFAPLKQVDAGVLNVGYVEVGPPGGPPVVLLHGWPYDIHSFFDVAPLLAAAGYRVLVPYLRGYGSTRFLSADTPRTGQPAATVTDLVAFMDALKLERATLAGFDWGARTAAGVAALWPQRCKALVSVSGYLIGSQQDGKAPLPPQAEFEWWYQYYFATERQLATKPVITVPTITLEGDANGAPHLPPAAYAGKFSGRYWHRQIGGGVGHNLPQEAPKEFAQAVIDVERG